MNNLFTGKNDARSKTCASLLHAAILPGFFIGSIQPIFAATPPDLPETFERLTPTCTPSASGKECHRYKKSTAHFLTSASTSFNQTTCWESAGAYFGIDPLLLKAIAWKESRGRPHAVGQKLKDGNVALGLMQINTIHLKNLRQFGIDRDKLFDACVSQQVGAWILGDCISQFGSTWKAVGCYYTGPRSNNVDAQVAYVNDVRRFYAGYRTQQPQRLIHFNEMD